MAKKPRQKCRHGMSPVYMQGCPKCVTTAMTAMHIVHDNGWTIEELWQLLHHAFPTNEALDAALAAVRDKIGKHGSIVECLDKVRDAGGNAWDKVSNPDAVLRGDEDAKFGGGE